MLNHRAMLALCFGQLCIGCNIVIAKVLVGSFPILFMLAIRYLISSLVLYMVMRLSDTTIERPQFSPFDRWIIFVESLCAGFLFNILIANGLKLTDASHAGIITSFLPFAIVTLSYFVLREHISRRILFCTLLSIVGLISINLQNQEHSNVHWIWLGDFLVLLALLPEALYTVLVKWHKKSIHTMLLAFYVTTINAVLLLPCAIWYVDFVPYIKYTWVLLFLGYGLFDALFYVYWNYGLVRSNATIAGLTTAIMPVSSVLLACLFLNETIDMLEWFGLVLVILSIVWGSGYFDRKRSQQSYE